MSSFLCPHCGTAIIDGGREYTTECEHYPLDKPMTTRVGSMYDRLEKNPRKRMKGEDSEF